MSCGNEYNNSRMTGREFFGELSNYNGGNRSRNISHFNNNVDYWRGNICYDVEMAYTGPYFYSDGYSNRSGYNDGIYDNNFRRDIRREERREERRECRREHDCDCGCSCDCGCGW